MVIVPQPQTETKAELLRKYLLDSEEFTEEELEGKEVTETEQNTLEVFGREYMVLTDEEADEKVKEDIMDSL
jgi:hypothetical protein